jgi:DNA-binding transcriptional MerR regulator
MEAQPSSSLPAIPAKRYFTIGEVSDLCGVKPHVLRYWEQEFTQLKPLKRRGNRRYYQHHEVLLIRRIRELLYEHGFTINGARNRLDTVETHIVSTAKAAALADGSGSGAVVAVTARMSSQAKGTNGSNGAHPRVLDTREIRSELKSILKMLAS